MVYPNQMVCVYQDNSYFNKRGEGDLGEAGELYDSNLATDGSRLTLKNVIQSGVVITNLALVGMQLVFTSTRTMTSQLEQGYLVSMPLSEIDILTQRHLVYAAPDSKAKKQRGIYTVKTLYNSGNTSFPTDLIQVGRTSFVIPYSCGSV